MLHWIFLNLVVEEYKDDKLVQTIEKKTYNQAEMAMRRMEKCTNQYRMLQ